MDRTDDGREDAIHNGGIHNGGIRDGVILDVGSDHGGSDRAVSDRAGRDRAGISSRTGGVLRPGGPALRGGVPTTRADLVVRHTLLHRIHDQIGGGPLVLLPSPGHAVGGIGKTQLAAQYVHQYGDEYDAIWWVPSEQPGPLRSSLTALARAMNIVESANVNRTLQAVRRALERQSPYKRWLIVFDSANNLADIEAYLPASGGHVLVTSRNPRWPGLTALEVGALTRAQSVHYLRSQGLDISASDAHLLAQRLGDVPMALGQAVAVQRAAGMSAEQYLSRYNERYDLVVTGGTTRGEAPNPVVITWTLALDGVRETDPSVVPLLHLFCFFACEPVSWELLWAGRNTSLPPELSAVLRIKRRLRAAMRRLGQFGLAHVDAADETIQMHRLVQLLLLAGLSLPEHEIYKRAALDLLAAADPADPDNPHVWPRYEAIAPHMPYAEVLYAQSDEARQLVLHHVRHLFARGDYDSSLEMAREAADQWRRRFGDDDEFLLAINYHLANALRLGSRLRAAYELNEDTLRRQRVLFGEDDENALATANSVGGDLRLRGRFDEARALDEANLSRHRKLFGLVNPATLRCANNLAADLRLLGRFDEALKLDEQTLAQRRTLFHGPHPETLSSISSLSRDRYGLGDYLDARDLLAPHLDEHRASLGHDHPIVLLAARHYAMALRKTGATERARGIAVETTAQYEDKFGDDHADSIAARISAAHCLRVAGDVQAALDLMRAAYNRTRRLLGDKHPFYLAAAVNLAIAERAVGNLDEAMTLDQAAHGRLVASLGETHLFTLAAANGLGVDLALRGRLDEALTLSATTRHHGDTSRPANHPDTLIAAHNHALNLIQSDDETGAALEATALHGLTALLGGRHPDVIAAAAGTRLEVDIETPPL